MSQRSTCETTTFQEPSAQERKINLSLSIFGLRRARKRICLRARRAVFCVTHVEPVEPEAVCDLPFASHISNLPSFSNEPLPCKEDEKEIGEDLGEDSEWLSTHGNKVRCFQLRKQTETTAIY